MEALKTGEVKLLPQRRIRTGSAGRNAEKAADAHGYRFAGGRETGLNIDRLAAGARTRIGALRSRVLRRANGVLRTITSSPTGYTRSFGTGTLFRRPASCLSGPTIVFN
jgi:hypothetical protein